MDCYHTGSSFVKNNIYAICVWHNNHVPSTVLRGESLVVGGTAEYLGMFFGGSDTLAAFVLEQAEESDQIANIRWIIKKAREFQKNIYFCFIDYAKAFYCVDHNELWETLKEM